MHRIDWLDRVGDWNPQLARELKGRWKPRLLWLAIGLSLFGQFMILIAFESKLPAVSENEGAKLYSDYCTGAYSTIGNQCLRNSLGRVEIDWSAWWFDIFQTMNTILPIVLLVGGIYILVRDMATEERRGTLDFVRLTPQSSHRILLGKILGVPSLMYLAIALALPLHFWAALQSGSMAIAIQFYIIIATACNLFYPIAVGLVSSQGDRAWMTIICTIYLLVFYWMYIPLIQSEYWNRNILLMDFPRLGFFWLCTCLVWLVISREFRKPKQNQKRSFHLFLGKQTWIS